MPVIKIWRNYNFTGWLTGFVAVASQSQVWTTLKSRVSWHDTLFNYCVITYLKSSSVIKTVIYEAINLFYSVHMIVSGDIIVATQNVKCTVSSAVVTRFYL